VGPALAIYISHNNSNLLKPSKQFQLFSFRSSCDGYSPWRYPCLYQVGTHVCNTYQFGNRGLD